MTSSPVSPDSLPVEHIRVGNHVWYSGSTVMSSWDCPAEIYHVDEPSRTFFVKSLDDMRTQSQPYSFELTAFSPASRKSMRAITIEEAMDFLDEGLVARRVIENPEDPDFPYAVEFNAPEGQIPTGMDFDAEYPPAKLCDKRKEFLHLWARKNGFTIVFQDDERALFRSEDDAVLCRLSTLSRLQRD